MVEWLMVGTYRGRSMTQDTRVTQDTWIFSIDSPRFQRIIFNGLLQLDPLSIAIDPLYLSFINISQWNKIYIHRQFIPLISIAIDPLQLGLISHHHVNSYRKPYTYTNSVGDNEVAILKQSQLNQ
ncbi:MAG: hypothetical protein EZS28_012732 [Streblomastix strix]|uniref:Uncharacterized protein n=1 Tax=Streblomastix strix TaxID=222440 RepID=A0A5J4WB32_9EUKA|nr:MAG: hypothetical protein EZS28_012732 [Streblomastix strix]